MTRWRVVMVSAVVALVGLGAAAQRAKPVVQIYKAATCGCCSLWAQHLERNGFDTRITEMDDVTPVKTARGVPARLQSCHTAVVDGYVIEGHVPAADVQRLLRERPAGVRGLAVPGMPIGSPGMEVGTTVQRYDVLAFDQQGNVRVFASYGR